MNAVTVLVEDGLETISELVSPFGDCLQSANLLGIHGHRASYSIRWVEDDEVFLRQHVAMVRSDHAFRRKARLRQSLWREAQGLPIGNHAGAPLGSRLEMPFAERTLANYLTDTIREVVRSELQNPEKLFKAPRIFDDLLSSQPLCFNLFAELRRDLALATRVFQTLVEDPSLRVTTVEFEHSPGRGDARFTGDHSAFDVYAEYVDGNGARGFVGIEVKYVEDMDAKPAAHKRRYDAVADAMGVFLPEARRRLRAVPLEQLWRDHLLAGSLLLNAPSGFAKGTFAVLYPSENDLVETAVRLYQDCLSDASGFKAWTLERVVDAIESAGAGEWIGRLGRRYL